MGPNQPKQTLEIPNKIKNGTTSDSMIGEEVAKNIDAVATNSVAASAAPTTTIANGHPTIPIPEPTPAPMFPPQTVGLAHGELVTKSAPAVVPIAPRSQEQGK